MIEFLYPVLLTCMEARGITNRVLLNTQVTNEQAIAIITEIQLVSPKDCQLLHLK